MINNGIYKDTSKIKTNQKRRINKEMTEKDLIVCESDKDHRAVIMNKNEYDSLIQGELNNTDLYMPLKTNNTESTKRKIIDILSELKSFEVIDNVTYKSVYPSYGRPGRVYALIKTHKSKVNNKWPVRLIVNKRGTPTYKLSKFLTK